MASRVKASVSKLTATLQSIRSGPSSKPLPSSIKSLRVVYHGLKGNAGARHWAKESLSSLKFSNPNVDITVEPKVVSKKGKEVEIVESTATTTTTDSWKGSPGIFFSFHDSPLSSFLALTPARSETLSKRFWNLVEDDAALEAFKKGEVSKIEAVAEVEPVTEGETVNENAEEVVEAAVEEKKDEVKEDVKSL